MKKILLGLGSITVIAAPIASVISCGNVAPTVSLTPLKKLNDGLIATFSGTAAGTSVEKYITADEMKIDSTFTVKTTAAASGSKEVTYTVTVINILTPSSKQYTDFKITKAGPVIKVEGKKDKPTTIDVTSEELGVATLVAPIKGDYFAKESSGTVLFKKAYFADKVKLAKLTQMALTDGGISIDEVSMMGPTMKLSSDAVSIINKFVSVTGKIVDEDLTTVVKNAKNEYNLGDLVLKAMPK